MSKKVAFLVDVAFRTRVVVDVPNDFREGDNLGDDILNALVDKAEPQLIERINNKEVGENITDIWLDTECPYNLVN